MTAIHHGHGKFLCEVGYGHVCGEEEDLKDTFACPGCYAECESADAYLDHKERCPGRPVVFDIPPPRAETVLEEAQRLVYGARQDDYGPPIEDFTRTGRIWGAILGIPDIDPRLVALMQGGVKMSREVNRPKRDNRTDLAGYAATCQLVAEAQGLEEGDGDR